MTTTWDGSAAEKEIHAWAGDDKGKPIPSKAKQCYMKYTGDGTKWGDYSYPVVRIKNGKPVTDEGGTQAAWGYARTNDPAILRDIINVRKAAGFGMTEAMKGWAKKNMKAKSLEFPVGILFEDDEHIHIAGPIIREGVFNGALQEFEDFKADIPGLVGLNYIRGEHPKDESGNFRPVEATDDIIGKLIDAKPVDDKKLAWGIWEINKKLLTQAELNRMHIGEPIGTSPGFFCDEVKLDKPQIYIPTGEIYYKIERGPRIFDHIASPAKPACKRCGPLHAMSQTGGGNIGEGEGKKESPDYDFKKFVVQGVWSDDELKKMIGECLALDNMMVDKRSAMEKLLTQILLGLDAAPIKVQSQNKEEGMDEKDIKLLVQSEEFKGAVAAATAEGVKPVQAELATAKETIAKQDATIKALEADKTAREEAAKTAATEAAASQEKSLKEKFISWLKPGQEKDADSLFEKAKQNIFQFRFENPAHFVAQSEQTPRFTPAGSKTSPGGKDEEIVIRSDGIKVKADSGEIDWAAMDIKSPQKLGEELGLLKPTTGGK